MPEFAQAQLTGASLSNPTSLQFGPDGRLYVSQVNGTIKAFSVASSATGFSVTATETINLVSVMPNHNDDGTFNAGILGRQVTGILVTGTAANPVIYVSSSDPRIGAGTSLQDTGLDTNSGILSRLTKTATGWTKEDLVVGLPRSEENHSVNGMQIDPATGHLLLTVGGNTNVGAPSAEFAYLPEYAYSSSIVDIDLAAINALPSHTYRGQSYKYVLPTVNDPTRADGTNGADLMAVGQPEIYGGNDGLNQARLTANSPVKIYATGFRNLYDLAFTEDGKLYGIDNGGNPTWGGTPIYQQADGSFSTAPTVEVTNRVNNGSGSVNRAPLHWIEMGYYGGHATPIRANPDGAGLYGPNDAPISLPVDWPPVPLSMANPVEGYYLPPGANRAALLPTALETPLNLRSDLTSFLGSVNGIDDFRASTFSGEMKGDLVAASLNEDAIYWIDLASDGKSVLRIEKLTPTGVVGSGSALDVHAAPEAGPFAGTLWVASYGGGITVLSPGTGTVTDDYDKDGLNDTIDRFAYDPANGKNTVLQGNSTLTWGFSQNQPYPGPADTLHNIGFTGVMINGTQSFRTQYDPNRVVAGGAASGVLLQGITEGIASGTSNNQMDAYQFGVAIASNVDSFVITARLDNPFDATTPTNTQNAGIFVGTGDQANFFKLVAGARTVNGVANSPAITWTFESNNAEVATLSVQAPIFGGTIPLTALDDIVLQLTVDPDLGTVTPSWSFSRGRTATSDGTSFSGAGAAVSVTGSLLQALKGTYTVTSPTGASIGSGVAVGLISDSAGPGAPFATTWKSVSLTSTAKPLSSAGAALLTMSPNGTLDQSTFDPNTLKIENLAQSGSNLQRVVIDLTNAILPDGIFFDPFQAGGNNGKPFTIDSKVGTFNVTAQYANGSATLGYRQLILDFTDFNPGEALGFSIDIDPDSMRGFQQSVTPGAVSGAEAAGAQVSYVFANGSQQVADLFGSGVAQAEARSVATQRAAPVLSLLGVTGGNVAFPSADPTVLVSGTPSALVRVEVMAVQQQVVSFPSPYQGNSATAVTYQTVQLDSAGKGSVSLALPANRVTVVAAAEVDTAGVVLSRVSSELRVIMDGEVPPQTGTVAINSGGAAYMDAASVQYVADTSTAPYATLAGSSALKTVTTAIGNTTEDALYQSYRYGKDFGYNIALADGSYTVEFQFVEPYWGGAGQRVFDVHLESQEVISNLDLFSAAGKNNAYVVAKTVTVSGGQLNVRFEASGADDRDNAIISALVVRPSTSAPKAPVNTVPGAKIAQEDQSLAITGLSVADADSTNLTTTLSVAHGTLNVSGTATGNGTGTITLSGTAAAINTALASLTYKAVLDYSGPDTLTVKTSDGSLQDVDAVGITVQPTTSASGVVAVNSGGAAYTDAASVQYVADTSTAPYATLAGSSALKTVTTAIGNTTEDALYQSYRYGKDFGYNIALADGSYTVEFQFVEPYWGGAGQRVFDVHLESQEVISNLDLFSAAGKNNAYVVAKTVTVSGGQLNVRFEASGADDRDNAIISALVVRPSDQSVSTAGDNGLWVI